MYLTSSDHIAVGAYNQNINKHMARHMVWLRKTMLAIEYSDSMQYCLFTH